MEILAVFFSYLDVSLDELHLVVLVTFLFRFLNDFHSMLH